MIRLRSDPRRGSVAIPFDGEAADPPADTASPTPDKMPKKKKEVDAKQYAAAGTGIAAILAVLYALVELGFISPGAAQRSAQETERRLTKLEEGMAYLKEDVRGVKQAVDTRANDIMAGLRSLNDRIDRTPWPSPLYPQVLGPEARRP